jgi:hypothetical protein
LRTNAKKHVRIHSSSGLIELIFFTGIWW